MKRNGVYRYSLQWAENTEEKIRVGELLEQLGNRKSTVIIAALNDYMDAHPELSSGNGKIEIKVFGYDRMEEMIRSMIQEQNLIGQSQSDTVTKIDIDDGITSHNGAFDENIVRMLDNLEAFNEL